MAISCQPYFERKLVNSSADKFAALHAACWTGGTLLYVPRGVALEKPLHNIAALVGANAAGGVNPVDFSKIWSFWKTALKRPC